MFSVHVLCFFFFFYHNFLCTCVMFFLFFSSTRFSVHVLCFMDKHWCLLRKRDEWCKGPPFKWYKYHPVQQDISGRTSCWTVSSTSSRNEMAESLCLSEMCFTSFTITSVSVSDSNSIPLVIYQEHRKWKNKHCKHSLKEWSLYERRIKRSSISFPSIFLPALIILKKKTFLYKKKITYQKRLQVFVVRDDSIVDHKEF